MRRSGRMSGRRAKPNTARATPTLDNIFFRSSTAPISFPFLLHSIATEPQPVSTRKSHLTFKLSGTLASHTQLPLVNQRVPPVKAVFDKFHQFLPPKTTVHRQTTVFQDTKQVSSNLLHGSSTFFVSSTIQTFNQNVRSCR